ncbi:hypothetical protein [Agilicoccus flavus]|uniref:hypothetical protein n=1 Tax=Agilicoccus flavus TaxID=2775968 RepID=UPI001CF65A2F|nr:hypothetical protein [Agilicoccus flavus]
MIDPGVDPASASITAWDLDGDADVRVGTATGEEALALDAPFRVTVVPAALVDPRRRR